MDVNDDFIEEYGQEIFENIFSTLYGDISEDPNDISISDRFKKDAINVFATGNFLFEDKTIYFELEDGDNAGSCIVSYSESHIEIKRVCYETKIILSEKYLSQLDDKKKDFVIKKYNSISDELDDLASKIDYDNYFSPTNKVKKYYNDKIKSYGTDNFGRNILEVDRVLIEI